MMQLPQCRIWLLCCIDNIRDVHETGVTICGASQQLEWIGTDPCTLQGLEVING